MNSKILSGLRVRIVDPKRAKDMLYGLILSVSQIISLRIYLIPRTSEIPMYVSLYSFPNLNNLATLSICAPEPKKLK